MAFTRITDDDTQNKGVIGLPDTPNLSTADMQSKIDELALSVIIPKINNLIEELENVEASKSLGVTVPEGLVAEGNLQSVVEAIYALTDGIGKSEHSHENKLVLDTITESFLNKLKDIAELLTGITGVTNTVNGRETDIVTAKAVSDYVQELGGGDMTRATYDSNRNGVVDDSEKLGGHLPEYYQASVDETLKTVAKTIVSAINELAEKEVDVLDTSEEIKANTDVGKVAGALGVKEMFDEVNNGLTANNNQFYFDYKDGKYGCNTDPNRGADTFIPFSGGVETIEYSHNLEGNWVSSANNAIYSFSIDLSEYAGDRTIKAVYLDVKNSYAVYCNTTQGKEGQTKAISGFSYSGNTLSVSWTSITGYRGAGYYILIHVELE